MSSVFRPKCDTYGFVHRLSRLGLWVVLLVLIVGVGGPLASSGNNRANLHACATSDLRITLTRSFAAMTNAGGYIVFTNRSRRACSLRGWPKVEAVTSTGSSRRVSPIQTISGHAGTGAVNEERVATVTLSPGGRGDAVVSGTDNPGYGATRCRSYVRFFRVAPPGETRKITISAWIAWLGGYVPGCKPLQVSMIVPASSLYRG